MTQLSKLHDSELVGFEPKPFTIKSYLDLHFCIKIAYIISIISITRNSIINCVEHICQSALTKNK